MPRKSKGQIKRELDETKKKTRLMKQVWDIFAFDQSQNKANDQTRAFMASLPNEISSAFIQSSNRVIQFGLSSGKFLRENNIPKTRDCIGYDYSEVSSSIAKAAGIKHRTVDLNDIECKSESLGYEAQLNEDLSVPCDILIIRLLEYMDKNAATLLIASLIHTAQPGSLFYIDLNVSSSKITNGMAADAVLSLFSQYENIEQIYLKSAPELGCEEYGITSRFVGMKR